jgi:N-acetylmuramoyl-L-alanine amidase
MRFQSPSQLKPVLAFLVFAICSFTLANMYPAPQKIDAGDYGMIPSTDGPGGPELRIVIPGRDTLTTSHSRHRIAAHTTPGSRAFINGREVTVYPTGAFAGLVEIPEGENRVDLRVVSPGGDSREKKLLFRRPKAPETTPSSPLVINSDMRLPDRILELAEGDLLEVRFRGSTGQNASFSIEGVAEDVPMAELPASQTGGLSGVYSARYIVDSRDLCIDVPVVFTLSDDEGNFVTAQSRANISITPNAFPRVAEITGRRAHLNTGTGTDRLGGVRMGDLVEGVRVTITGREGGFYRVRLTDDLDGYLPVRFAHMLPEHTPLPESETGSITVSGNDSFDLVTISLGRRLPYLVTKHTHPNIIEVDIFGARSNTRWLNHQTEAAGIDSVEWEQAGPDRFRLRIHLKHDLHWGTHVRYGAGTSLNIQVQRPPRRSSGESVLDGIAIAIDAGHGGSNFGALGATGAREKDIALDIARRVRDKLEKDGSRVIMVRDSDTDIPIPERSEMLIASDASVLVSIHANSIAYNADPLAIHGVSSFYRYNAFRPFARAVHDRLLELPLRNFGLTGSFNFTLNALTEMPTVLVETAFLSNPEDEMKLLDPEFRDAVAEKIVEGLRDFFREHALPHDHFS